MSSAGAAWRQHFRSWCATALLGAFLTALGWYGLPERTISVDFICYISAAQLLASGHSPYDLDAEIEAQRELGWDKTTDGFGKYDCLPYFYPPWFALACTTFLPLGYRAGRVAFFALNVGLALASGRLLRGMTGRVPAWVAPVLVPLFVFTIICALLAQTSLIVLFLAALAWKLLNGGRDRAAGAVLAWLTIKPQLTAVLLVGVLLWALRRRRWGVLAAFLVTLGLLGGLCLLIVPTWPAQMVNAPRQAVPPTEFYPWIGNTWFLLLRAWGAEGWGLWLPFLGLAVPAVVLVVRRALDRTRPVVDVFAAGFLAAFFVAPYARHYDFPVLLIPALALFGTRLPRVACWIIAAALLVVPYVQFVVLGQIKASHHPQAKFLHEGSFFWVPLVLAAGYIAGLARRSASASSAETASARGKSDPVIQ
jgi:hypothetical protein